MAKIGVITFSQTLDNYGQVLQYLAIQEYLEGRGHQVNLIRQYYHSNVLKRIARKIKKAFRKKRKVVKNRTTFDKWSECTAKNEALHPRGFETFRKNNCNIYNLQLPAYQKHFDAFVVGSDQIWSSTSPFCYLNFAKYGEVKFTLAPSIGKMMVDEHVISMIKDWLHDFKFITCREQSAVNMCRKAGRDDAQLVLDPTFLISKDLYLKYASPTKKECEYIFVYLLGADISVEISAIFDFAKKEGLAVKYVASQGRKDDYPKEWATIPEWLSLLANAKYVFTNSFHGMALSCIFQKQFLVFPIVGEMKGMNERIYNIANEFKCEDRLFSKYLEEVKKPIDYDYILSKIESNRKILNSLLDTIHY